MQPQSARALPEAFALNRVHQLVGQQRLSLERHHLMFTAIENDVVAYRERPRADAVGDAGRCGIAVNADIGEVMRETRFGEGTCFCVERLTVVLRDKLERTSLRDLVSGLLAFVLMPLLSYLWGFHLFSLKSISMRSRRIGREDSDDLELSTQLPVVSSVPPSPPIQTCVASSA